MYIFPLSENSKEGGKILDTQNQNSTPSSIARWI